MDIYCMLSKLMSYLVSFKLFMVLIKCGLIFVASMKLVLTQFLFFMLNATDCPFIMSFLRYLNMNTRDNSIYKILPGNCCGYQSINKEISITCNSTTITSLKLQNLNINGTINGTALPLNIQTLEITFKE
eukprot:NODE_975_length_2816_cov_0.464851.p2 type:complete len:130 gc:universal NODE_975_length_2816_cov_0.464851:1780-1391(-)